MKNIALMGGSFNPPHSGHFEMARYIYETLKVDEVWFLFSQNWQKDPSKYVSDNHRIEMGRILASHHYPDFPFVMSNIQNEIGTHMTYEVLTELKRRFPENRFIWTMGADNLATFHTWENASDIMENFPIAVLDRPPYTQAAQSSYMALTYAHLKTETAKDLRDSDTGWHFLNNPLMDMSSSSLLADLFNAKANDDPRMKEVLEYIREHGLYPQSTSAQPNSTLNKG